MGNVRLRLKEKPLSDLIPVEIKRWIEDQLLKDRARIESLETQVKDLRVLLEKSRKEENSFVDDAVNLDHTERLLNELASRGRRYGLYNILIESIENDMAAAIGDSGVIVTVSWMTNSGPPRQYLRIMVPDRYPETTFMGHDQMTSSYRSFSEFAAARVLDEVSRHWLNESFRYQPDSYPPTVYDDWGIRTTDNTNPDDSSGQS